MSNKKTKAVLFDLDGTLWDASGEILPAWNEVLANYPDLRGPVTQEELGSYMGMTPPVMASHMFPMLPPDEALRMLYLCFNAEEKAIRARGAILYEGVEALLETLHEDYFVSVVSNSQDGYVQAFLDYYDLWRYVDDIEMAGRTGKPKWDNITLVLERAGIDRENALYIGDTQGDLDAADRAGVRFIFADYGFGKVDRTTPSAKAPSGLLPIIRELLGGELMQMQAKVIEIHGENRHEIATKTRVGCRGIVVRDGDILISHEQNTDQYFIPGGGLEEGETLGECCARELLEETGYAVKPTRHFLTINEYYEEYKYVSHYFVCEVIEKREQCLTAEEAARGLVPEWLPLSEMLEVFGAHEDHAATNEEKRGAYLREYSALVEYGKMTDK